MARKTLKHLESIRLEELNLLLRVAPSHADLLEIGAGAGWQAKRLSGLGFNVEAIDVSASSYHDKQVYPVKAYDGYILPFEDESFDVIFSSNVLEHIPHAIDFQKEISRVLRLNGVVVHILPSVSWRFWTTLSGIFRLSLPGAHGAIAGNAFSELFYFSTWYWRRVFIGANWHVTQDTNKLFYTGHSILDATLSISLRKKLSRIVGSSCNVFILHKII